jgi:hypothetical protein
MPTNNFIPVAATAGANVTADASWNGSSFQTTGVQKGIVPSAGMNKAWRQGTMGASALGQIIVDHGLIDAVDDGSVTNLKANLRMAFAAMLASVAFAVDGSGTPNLITVILDPAPPTLATYRGIFVRVANTNTGAVTLTFNNLGTKPVVRKNGLPLVAGDIVQGQFIHVLYDLVAGQWVIAGSVPSDTVAILTSKQIVGGQLYLQKTAGTYSFTIPAGVTSVRVQLWGGGGGGGGSTAAGNVGSGGAGGGYAEGIFTVSPGQALSIAIGAGGGPTVTGGTTSISGLPTAISATGGGGGVVGNNGAQSQSPSGGQGYGGQIQRMGRFGGVGLAFGSGIYAGGFGGASGYQGADAQFGLNVGIPGIGPGGGGGGANNGQVGGSGADGQVSIYY